MTLTLSIIKAGTGRFVRHSSGVGAERLADGSEPIVPGAVDLTSSARRATS